MSEMAASGNWAGRRGWAVSKAGGPLLGYGFGAIAAAAVYAVLFLAWPPAFGGQMTLNFTPGPGAFFAVFFAFLPALLVLAPPWAAVAWLGRRRGLLFFAACGVAGVFVIGCAAAALDPETLFLESRSFWDAAGVAAARQGAAFMLAGLIFGSIYGLCNISGRRASIR